MSGKMYVEICDRYGSYGWAGGAGVRRRRGWGGEGGEGGHPHDPVSYRKPESINHHQLPTPLPPSTLPHPILAISAPSSHPPISLLFPFPSLPFPFPPSPFPFPFPLPWPSPSLLFPSLSLPS